MARAPLILLLLLALPAAVSGQTLPFDLGDSDSQQVSEYLDQEIRKVRKTLRQANISTHAAALLTSSQTFSGENTFTSTTTLGNVRKICPAAFTEVHSNGNTMGCIQTDRTGSSDDWSGANEDCFATYPGGRLPTTWEWSIACNNYALTNELTSSEWLNDFTASGNSAATGTSTCTPDDNATTGTSMNYRCFFR